MRIDSLIFRGVEPGVRVQRRAWGIAAVIGSAIGFGAMSIFARQAYADGADITAVLFLRFLAAGLLMALLMFAWRRPWPRPFAVGVLALMGGGIYVLQSYSFFKALQHASAGLVGLLLYLYPFIVTVLGALLFREPLGVKRVAAVGLALAGTGLTLWGGITGSPAGIAFGVIAALLYSAYILVGSRVLKNEEPFGAAAVVMLSAAAVFGLMTWIGKPSFPQSASGWLAIAAIAVFSTVIAIVGFFIGVRILGAADASTLSTLEPVVTILLAAIFLGERLEPVQLVGAAVVLGAVVWLTRIRR
ncbi:MAG: EamA/RhaT family transporter [Betaproteobacteria bacterium]|nr:EamA/RhaT family transporter [Betaproteobacteria bacterium]